MLKRLCTALLAGGLLVALTPVAAVARPASAKPAAAKPAAAGPGSGYHALRDDGCYGSGCRPPRDDHYRCMYRCDGRYRYGYDRHRRDRYCWYRDRYGWYRARCRYDDGYHGGYPEPRSGGDDGSHADGGYDSHRQHSG